MNYKLLKLKKADIINILKEVCASHGAQTTEETIDYFATTILKDLNCSCEACQEFRKSYNIFLNPIPYCLYDNITCLFTLEGNSLNVKADYMVMANEVMDKMKDLSFALRALR